MVGAFRWFNRFRLLAAASRFHLYKVSSVSKSSAAACLRYFSAKKVVPLPTIYFAFAIDTFCWASKCNRRKLEQLQINTFSASTVPTSPFYRLNGCLVKQLKFVCLFTTPSLSFSACQPYFRVHSRKKRETRTNYQHVEEIEDCEQWSMSHKSCALIIPLTWLIHAISMSVFIRALALNV